MAETRIVTMIVSNIPDAPEPMFPSSSVGCTAPVASIEGRDDVPAPNPTTSGHRAQQRKGFDVAVTIKPLEDRILVQPLEAEQTTASGLVIPDTAKEKPQEGKVLATGPGRIDDNGNRIPLDVAEGDVVIFSKYGGTEVKYNGQEYLLLNARDILAVVTK